MLVRAAHSFCLAAALLAALGGCGAIDAYRSVRGLDKNDPDPATAPFSKNLAAGEVADYPNLSTVPPPPTRASTVAERAALTKKLVEERTSAEADAASIQAPAAAPVAENAASTTAAPALRPAKKAPLAAVAAAEPVAPIASAPAPAPAKPPAAAAAAGPTPRPTASAAPAANPSLAPAATAEPAPAPAATPASPAAKAPPAAVAAAAPTPAAADQPTTANRRRGSQAREAPPQESSLQMPEIASVPQPEATRPPPAPPRLGAAPAVGPNDMSAAKAAIEMPAQPPPVPVMAPSPPVLPVASEPRQRAEGASVAAFDLAEPPRLAPDQRARLDQLAAAYRDKPGTVKIVAYAAPAPAGPEQLSSYRAALDRAQYVASALAAAGVPSNKIQTEAAPAGAAAAPGRVEVRLTP